MIPIKIISKEEAVKLGLTEEKTDRGLGFIAASCVGKKEKDGSITEVERVLLKANGDKELVFISEERKADFKNKGMLKDYIKQFKKIPENVKKDIN